MAGPASCRRPRCWRRSRFSRLAGGQPAHAAAFEAVDRMWSDVGGLTDLRPDLRDRRASSEETAPRHTSRRALLAGVGLLAVAGGSVGFWRSAGAKVYETEVGEQKHVALADGSQLFLDAQTRISVRFSETVRAVDMEFGRANFRVVPDYKRPSSSRPPRARSSPPAAASMCAAKMGRYRSVLIHGEADVKPASAPDAKGETLRSGDEVGGLGRYGKTGQARHDQGHGVADRL